MEAIGNYNKEVKISIAVEKTKAIKDLNDRKGIEKGLC